MPAWLDQLLVLVVIGSALAYLWWSVRRKKRALLHSRGTAGAPPCAGGCCTPKRPPHLKPRR